MRVRVRVRVRVRARVAMTPLAIEKWLMLQSSKFNGLTTDEKRIYDG